MAVTDAKFNPTNNDNVTAIKEASLAFEAVLEKHCPAGRHKAVALTNLETASMWAVKSLFV